MKPKLILLIFPITAAIFGCDSPRYAASSKIVPTRSLMGELSQGTEPITKSLFETKDRTISEENIQKLLNGELKLPDTVKVAVFKYSGSPLARYYYNYRTDEDYLKTQQIFIDTILKDLEKSKRVKKAVVIPAMMVSASPTITSMRETAVRLQADLLLVVSITSDLYYKYRLLQKDEAKAFATTECMLMDVRTALVPYSSIITKDYYSKKLDEDANLEELRKRTEKTAILASLAESGMKLDGYLNNAP